MPGHGGDPTGAGEAEAAEAKAAEAKAAEAGPAPADVLVLGIGNDLRGDDGVGPVVARAVAHRGLPGVEVREVHQLAPEHAADLSDRRLVVFVDARVGAAVDAGVQVAPVAASAGSRSLTHHLDPGALLDLAAALGWPVPEAVAVTVPARALELGTALSPGAAADARDAVAVVVGLCAAGAEQARIRVSPRRRRRG